ncbi:hypothetical protein [Pseudacidobacterium ailaaui]|jgi:hypothetical protein|uniref:hypothetical protein n=1 Tax=Pseudacidobacterium ailaaui TaxID=1382359 RepID=UPI000479D14F|nr:hypothetical protein [Pseudacidobacterium ailaaui]MBX6358484.1 hypothetical protein [Pseudacidobacterium ailaaui]MDI3254240.1 hypothetical protein [Bacillota bacterium]
MSRDEIIAAIDEEISRLEKVRALLEGSGSSRFLTGALTTGRKKRHLSADARRRIAEAQKRRWAKQKKQAVPVANPAK